MLSTIRNASNRTTLTMGDEPNNEGSFIQHWFKCLLFMMYVFTCVLGNLGNLSIIFLIIKKRKLKRVIHILTLNLAVSDMLVLSIYLPSQLHLIHKDMKWDLGQLSCRFFYIVNAFAVNASICTLVAITRDRYLAVCKPMETRSRSIGAIKLWIPVIWITSFVATLPLMFVVDIKLGYCTESGWPNVSSYRTYWIILFCMQILIPIISFIISYTVIIHKFSKKKPNQLIAGKAERCRRASRRAKQKQKLLKMSVMLIVVYTLCSSPQHVVFLLHSFGDLQQGEKAFYAYSLANFLMILNSALNPVIYSSQTYEIKKYVSKTLPVMTLMRKTVARILKIK